MRASLLTLLLASSLAVTANAQPAPAGAASANCRDGSTQSGNTAAGACRGHGGVLRPATASTSAVPPSPEPPAGAAPVTPGAPAAAAGRRASAPLAAEAPGGGPGLVWVNSSSKVYHCPGDKYYGRTRHGSYMTEAAAKTAGDHGSGHKACTPAQ